VEGIEPALAIPIIKRITKILEIIILVIFPQVAKVHIHIRPIGKKSIRLAAITSEFLYHALVLSILRLIVIIISQMRLIVSGYIVFL
jgi:hypothetical protein